MALFQVLAATLAATGAHAFVAKPTTLPQLHTTTRPSVRAPVMVETLLNPADVDAKLPTHPAFRRGTLKNGLAYVILPNASPAGRFEAHLEVFAGSADERDDQQGIAHLVEHVAYMGSRKRERLFGTGSQTNAYTDFHHTVFYACCPDEAPQPEGALNQLLLGRGGSPMLPRALDALCEVLQAQFLPARVEKERAAVLSEMSMVNTIEYRVECQILRTLHAENALARRFPIGLEDQIKNWSVEDVVAFHAEHYRPDNALLYVVGDVKADDVELAIRTAFDGVPKASLERATKPCLKAQSRHFPPIVHEWSGGAHDRTADVVLDGTKVLEITDAEKNEYLLPLDVPAVPHPVTGVPVRAHVFQHELLQQFSFHLFAKRPVERITTLAEHRAVTTKRIVLSALQVRLNVLARAEPLFSFVEFQHLDSAREACAVCSLDMNGDAARWEEAVAAAVKETRRMGQFGLTQSELERFGAALVTDSEQLAAMGDQLAHGEQLTHLMETVACEHTFMDPETSHEATILAVESLKLDEVNAVARDLMAHVVDFGEENAARPSAMIACSPAFLANGTPVTIDAAQLLAVAAKAATEPIEPEPELIIPSALMEREEVAAMLPEKVIPVSFAELAGADEASAAQALGVRAQRLANGARIMVKGLPHEAQRGALRLTMAGGREGEQALKSALGSAAVGARTLQEGGAFDPWSREQVELFCVDRLIMVEVTCSDEKITVDFGFPTPPPRSGGCSGVEAALQLVHKILYPGAFLWEDDAFRRAQIGHEQQTETSLRSMEGAAQEKLLEDLLGRDERFLSLLKEDADALTVDDVKTCMLAQLDPSNVEISVVGDFDAAETERLAVAYVGSVPRPTEGAALTDRDPSSCDFQLPKTPGSPRRVHVPDSDPRAVAYVMGAAPNRLGVLADGRTLVERLLGTADLAKAPERWRHPLFAAVALSLVQEVANRRLFSVVRERRQLTYDANFRFSEHERIKGGWYLVSVTASRANAEKALDACRETLQALGGSSPPTPDNLEAARRVLINRHLTELTSNKYWCEQLTGCGMDAVPQRTLTGLRDYPKLAEQVTIKDLQVILKALDTSDDKIHTCIGTSGADEADGDAEVAAPPVAEQHGGVMINPMMGGGRGR